MKGKHRAGICMLMAILFVAAGHAVPGWAARSDDERACHGVLLRVDDFARAQNPDTMRPEESAARAKELIQQMIRALGGEAYLNVRDITRTGRLAMFDSKGELSGYTRFWDFVKLPDKNRTEYGKKRNVIDVYSGDHAWTLDRGGVQEISVDRIERFKEGNKKDLDILLRFRLNEEGLIFRYGGSDLVDMKPVDWVEIVDRERITTRVALSRADRLPLRAVYITRNPATRSRTEEVEIFAAYHTFQGVKTPKQITRTREGRVIFQVFFEEVQYNTGLDDSFFSKAALEQAWVKLGKK
ncbi:MAG TPA: hypothetical protein VNL38_03505 [Candidatus Nitrosotenuis sp.]|nr:hypothetical protein [Candidatus Nitrosotenuis sp.]